jgi:hypothetical protein
MPFLNDLIEANSGYLGQRSNASGDGGNDKEGITFVDGRLRAVSKANILFVKVDIDETAELISIIKVLPQIGILGGQIGKCFPDRFSIYRDVILPTRIGSQRRWYSKNWHLLFSYLTVPVRYGSSVLAGY